MVEWIIITALSICIFVLAKKVHDLQTVIRNMDYNQFMNSMNYEMDNENKINSERIMQ